MDASQYNASYVGVTSVNDGFSGADSESGDPLMITLDDFQALLGGLPYPQLVLGLRKTQLHAIKPKFNAIPLLTI